MTALTIAPIEMAELRARAAYEEGKLLVAFAGSADSRAMASIDSLLKELHGEMLRSAVPEVTLDFREFDFMNSSCFKAFVVWISNLRELESAKQYRISFRSDPNKHWQRRSLDALRCFGVDLIRIET
jgi:hypothetical protein